jgi:hypothetical protein
VRSHSGVGYDFRCIKLDSRSEAMADCHSFHLTIGYEDWDRKVVMDDTAAGRSVLQYFEIVKAQE